MAVTHHEFPPRKRRPSAGAFVTPNLSDRRLLQSLLHLSQEISSRKPSRLLLHRCSVSLIRKTKLLSVLLEEVYRNSPTCLSPSAALCFEELHILLQRINAVIEDCSNGSRMWLLFLTETIARSFHELTIDLSTLLDILPVNDLELNIDVEELLSLIKKQCSETKIYIDDLDSNLRRDVLNILDEIKHEIVPNQTKLIEIFNRLEIRDSVSCRDEIEALEDEVQNQLEDRLKEDVIALIGLVRYAKCVLFGASTPRSGGRRRRKPASDVNIPADFRCPISLDLMRDPVVVATGQTYDRGSITAWIESGHNTCPKTAQVLAHTNLLANSALRNLIRIWCREQRIQFDIPEVNDKVNGLSQNKTALEATKMTVLFLINKLTSSNSPDSANRLVHELRVLAKSNSDCRRYVGEAGGLPILVKFLGSDHPNLQVNAITAILNLSILESNKKRIMETEGVLNGVLEVLRSGATWESKGNAAATIFSLTGIHSNRRRLGRKTRVVKGLLDLAKLGIGSYKKDALMAILSLAGDREAVGKLIEGGIVEMIEELMDSGLREEAVTILEVIVKRGGAAGVAAAYHLITKLARLMSEGSDRTKESAAATLVNLCRKGGNEVVVELAAVSGIERVIWELMGMGIGRSRRKAASLLRILRRWAVGLDSDSAETWRFLVLA
ncbi:U-box domain-containing protein 16 [Impatiens glandulifera]|uniref:U-box domain-containing protein 16 n=1 Tax=Impatiens glandulifera TaxID=253017 RepID=UPI001FB1631F|nr:U-box domain-containing protein 16 [Impatiens glandulifera]